MNFDVVKQKLMKTDEITVLELLDNRLTEQDRLRVDAWCFRLGEDQPCEHDLYRLYLLGKGSGHVS